MTGRLREYRHRILAVLRANPRFTLAANRAVWRYGDPDPVHGPWMFDPGGARRSHGPGAGDPLRVVRQLLKQ